MFNVFNPKCPKCGHSVARDAAFCPDCGTRLAGATRRCGVCGVENRSDATFCGGCGRSLDQAAAPEIIHHRWARPEADFAVRVEADDLPGLLKRGLKVEPGTNALMVAFGAANALLPPGEYTLGTIGQRVRDWFSGNIPERVTILLVDVTPTDLEFNLGGRFTSDPLPIGVTLRAQVEVADPGAFLVNVLKGRERLSKEDIRLFLYPEVVAVADRWLRQHTLQQLVDDPEQRSRLELALEESLRITLKQTGLRLLQVRTAELNLEQIEGIQVMSGKAELIDRGLAAKARLAEAQLRQAEADLQAQTEHEQRIGQAKQRLSQATNENERQVAEAELKHLQSMEFVRQVSDLSMESMRKDYEARKADLDLDARKKLEALQKENDLLAYSEETRKVEAEERRADLYERMRQAVLNDKMSEIRSEADFKALVHQMGGEELLREKERQDLLRTWGEQGEDQEKARAHTLAKLETEHDYELRMARIKSQRDLSAEQLQMETDLERMRADKQMQIESARYEYELRRRREEQEFEQKRLRDQREYDFEQRRREDEYVRQKETLDSQAKRTQGAAESDEQFRQDERFAEFGIRQLRAMKDVKFEEQSKQWELDRQKRDFEQQIAQKQRELEWEQEKYKLQGQRDQQMRQLDIDLQRERERMKHEIDRLQALGPDAIYSTLTPDQAAQLAKQRRTTARAGMTEAQILADAAESSPEAARALQEKFRAEAEANEKVRKEAEATKAEASQAQQQTAKMQAEQHEAAFKAQQEVTRQARDDADKRAEDLKQSQKESNEVVKNAMEHLSGTAQAFARSQPPPQPAAPPTIIVVPTGGGTPVAFTPGGAAQQPPAPGASNAQAGEPAATKLCVKCGRTVPDQYRFCPHCNNKFEGVG